jgi:Glycosyl transferase family 2
MNSQKVVPTVSVVLAVRNGGNDLHRAIGTILNQSFAGLELIVIDDGSTDGTCSYLENIVDSRVRVFHQTGAGLASALNRGISLAQGRYIARQDHDDLSDLSRLAKQVAFLDAHPDHALVGTCAEIWSADAPSGRFHDHPAEDEILRFDLLFNNPFVHSSVMMRKAALDHVGVYTTDPARQPPEDYELWSRISRYYRVANLPERLMVYREVPTSICRASAEPFLEKLVTVSSENLAHATGAALPEQVHIDIAALIHGAVSRVSQKPDIEAMSAVITEAGQAIGKGKPGPELAQRIANAQHQIRYHMMLREPVYGRAWRTARGHLRRLRQAVSFRV